MITPRNIGLMQQGNANGNNGGNGVMSPLPSPSSADFLTSFGIPGFVSPSGQNIHPHGFSPAGSSGMQLGGLAGNGMQNGNDNGVHGGNSDLSNSNFLPLLSTTNGMGGAFPFPVPATPLSACTTPLNAGGQQFSSLFGGGVNSLMNGLLGQPSPRSNNLSESPKREAGTAGYPSPLIPGMGAEPGPTPRISNKKNEKKTKSTKKSKKDIAVEKAGPKVKKKHPHLPGVSQERQNRQYTMLRKRSACHFCSEIGENCGLVAGKCPNRPCTNCGGRHRHGRCRLKRPINAKKNAVCPPVAGVVS